MKFQAEIRKLHQCLDLRERRQQACDHHVLLGAAMPWQAAL